MATKNFEFEEIKSGKERHKDNSERNTASRDFGTHAVEMLMDIPVTISVELGRVRMRIDELMKLTSGSVIELNKLVGETLDIYINDKLVARGEAVVTNDKIGIRLTEFSEQAQRLTAVDDSSSSAA